MYCLIELVAKYLKIKFNLNFLLKKKKKKEKILLSEIIKKIKELGIEENDTIMVHSSLSHVNTSPKEFIDALKKLVGPNGNILMPTHPILNLNKEGKLTYNKIHSSSKVGYLTEYFHKLPDVERSSHPFSSVAVWGKDKEYFLKDNIKNDLPLPHGINSPYYKFSKKNGKTLCIGVTAKNRGTIKHVAEEVLDKKFNLNIFEDIDVFLEEENSYKKFRQTILSFSMLFMCKSKIEKDWIKWGVLKRENINSTPIEVLDANKCVTMMIENIKNGSSHYPFAPKRFKNVN